MDHSLISIERINGSEHIWIESVQSWSRCQVLAIIIQFQWIDSEPYIFLSINCVQVQCVQLKHSKLEFIAADLDSLHIDWAGQVFDIRL